MNDPRDYETHTTLVNPAIFTALDSLLEPGQHYEFTHTYCNAEHYGIQDKGLEMQLWNGQRPAAVKKEKEPETKEAGEETK